MQQGVPPTLACFVFCLSFYSLLHCVALQRHMRHRPHEAGWRMTAERRGEAKAAGREGRCTISADVSMGHNGFDRGKGRKGGQEGSGKGRSRVSQGEWQMHGRWGY